MFPSPKSAPDREEEGIFSILSGVSCFVESRKLSLRSKRSLCCTCKDAFFAVRKVIRGGKLLLRPEDVCWENAVFVASQLLGNRAYWFLFPAAEGVKPLEKLVLVFDGELESEFDIKEYYDSRKDAGFVASAVKKKGKSWNLFAGACLYGERGVKFSFSCSELADWNTDMDCMNRISGIPLTVQVSLSSAEVLFLMSYFVIYYDGVYGSNMTIITRNSLWDISAPAFSVVHSEVPNQVLVICNQDTKLSRFMGIAFRKSHREILRLVEVNPLSIMDIADEKIFKDPHFCMVCIETNPVSYLLLPHCMKADCRVACEAVTSEPSLLFHAPEEVKKNKSVVLRGVGYDGTTVRHADVGVAKERDIALMAVLSDPRAEDFIPHTMSDSISEAALLWKREH